MKVAVRVVVRVASDFDDSANFPDILKFTDRPCVLCFSLALPLCSFLTLFLFSFKQGVGVPASSSIISSLLQHIKPLQDGEKMQLKIKGLSHQHQSQNTCSKEKEKEKEGKSVFKIKPPPPPIPAAANEDQGWDDEEFGSWESGSGASLSSSSIVDSTVSAPEAT